MRIDADPVKAFRRLAPQLGKAARRKDPARAIEIVSALARHGDTLPVTWRKLLVEMADEDALSLSASVGLAQVKPHRSMVPPMVRRLAAKLDARAASSDSVSWDDEIALAVLARCADARAGPVLVRLLAAPRVAHWDLMLEACVRAGSPALIPAVRRWLARAKKQGVDLNWDGFAEGKRALEQLAKR